MIEIRWATREEIGAYAPKVYAHLIEEAFIGLEAPGRCFGMVSFANDPDDPISGSFLDRSHGRRWAFMDLKPGAEKHGLKIVRRIAKYLHDVNETTFVTCGGQPKAEKLLRTLGFEPTDEMKRGARVWVWQRWPA